MTNLIPFQWSIKLPNGEIYMVQSTSAEDLALAKQEIKSKFNLELGGQGGETVARPTTPSAPVASVGGTVVCTTCGASTGTKTGNKKDGTPWVLHTCTKNYKHNWFDE